MVDLVVDHVHQQVRGLALIGTECLDRLVKALRRNLRPELVDLRGGLIPQKARDDKGDDG
jgi:hypothetical protein